MGPIKILLVSDNPGDARLVNMILAQAGQSGSGQSFVITPVEGHTQALAALAKNEFEVVLLDLALPDSQGLASLRWILEAAPGLPVIVMSDGDDQTLALEAVKAGAQDYLVKGYINRYSLPRAIHYAIERQRTELALRQSETKLRTLFNLLPVGIAILDQDREVMQVNPALEKILGLSYQDLRSHKHRQRAYLRADGTPLPPAEFPSAVVLAERRLVENVEIGAITETAERIWMNVSAAPVDFADWQVVMTITDITRQKWVEASLRQRNRELALLNQVIAASVNTPEPEAILEAACRELALIFDLPQVVAVLFDEAKTEAVVAAEYLAEGQPASLNRRIPLKRKSLLTYLLDHRGPLVIDNARTDTRLTLVRDLVYQYQAASLVILPLIVDGDIVGLLVLKAGQSRYFPPEETNLAWSVADQLAGALARIRLNQLHRHLSAAMDQAAEAVVITDVDARIIYVNPAFERMTGYSRAEVLGQNPRLLRSGQQSEAFYTHLWATITAGQVWNGRLVNKRKDGRLYTEEMTITPVRNNKGIITHYVAVKDDVTAKLQLEEQLHQSQKMDAIGRLAGGIAHDFNNLLTIITGYSELLLTRDLPLDESMRKDVEQISKAGERASVLTRQLLAFSRKQTLEPHQLNLNMVIADIEKMLHRLIGEDIELVTILAPDLGQVLIDPGQLEQIIMNLVINARDAMPEGGKLTLETANVNLDERYVHEHAEVQPGPYVMIAVSDTGIGMDKATSSRIFEPFFTTKTQGQGTGLGLATVYGIVKQSSGSIWVYSEPEHGATFKIYLPRLVEVAEPLEAKPTLPELSRGSETILIVEDEASVRDFIGTVLEVNGYTVLAAANGQEALALCQQHPQPIDLLLTDWIMPGINGHKLAEQLTRLRPNLKVLFISGYTGNTIIRQGIPEVGRTLLEKPFSPGQLVSKVREVLDGQ